MEESEEKELDKEPLRVEEPITLEWEAPEFVYRKKNMFWYVIAGTVTALAALDVYLMDNVLFAAFIVLCGFTLIFLAEKRPRTVSYAITRQGILMNDELRRFYEYQSFWVSERKEGNFLLLSPNKLFGQQTVIPLIGIDPVAVRDTLFRFLPEVEESVSLTHLFSEYLGF